MLCRKAESLLELFLYRREKESGLSASLLAEVGNIYVGILVHRVRKVTEGLIDDEQGDSDQGGVCMLTHHSKTDM